MDLTGGGRNSEPIGRSPGLWESIITPEHGKARLLNHATLALTTGSDAYRPPDGIGVVPAALLGP
jgi:hypothetical protein